MDLVNAVESMKHQQRLLVAFLVRAGNRGN